jgi:hypothetical protein
LALLGGFVVVASQAFPSAVLGWIAVGVAIGVACIALVAQLDRTRGGVQRTLDAASVGDAGLLLVFALTASGTTVIWLSFAFALGIVALAFTGLTVNEVAHWRARHQLRNLRWLPDPDVAVAPQSRAA